VIKHQTVKLYGRVNTQFHACLNLVLNRFAALENLNTDQDVNRAWENIKENIKTTAKESLGLHELKQLKP
jgi:hypothetical protein